MSRKSVYINPKLIVHVHVSDWRKIGKHIFVPKSEQKQVWQGPFPSILDLRTTPAESCEQLWPILPLPAKKRQNIQRFTCELSTQIRRLKYESNPFYRPSIA
jgi:hypothetical protein